MIPDVLERPADLDTEALQCLVDSLEDELEVVTHKLLALEREPADPERVHSLFRSIHSIKGNCRMCFLTRLSDFVHALEDSLSQVRDGRLPVSMLLSEAVLLSLDQVKLKAEELLRAGRTDMAPLQAMIPYYQRLSTAPAEADEQLGRIVEIGGGRAIAELRLHHQANRHSDVHVRLRLDDRELDIAFFRTMGTLVDDKCPYWNLRTDTQLKLALGINRHLRTGPVDPAQLVAAICLHDLGMAFLPAELVNKAGRYNLMEEQQAREHVQWSHEWVRRLQGWGDAALMVQQHHERPDGSGYPAGLSGGQIHDGAQIVAVADTFFAVTNERADRTYKKSLLRAITEINAYDGVQFRSPIVEAFNELMREIYARQNDSGVLIA